MRIDQVQAIALLLKQLNLLLHCKQVDDPCLITHPDDRFLSRLPALGLGVRRFGLRRLHRDNLDWQRYSDPWFELAHIDLYQLSLLGVSLLLSASGAKPCDLFLAGLVALGLEHFLLLLLWHRLDLVFARQRALFSLKVSEQGETLTAVSPGSVKQIGL